MQQRLLAQLYNPILPDTLGGGPQPSMSLGVLNFGRLLGALIGFFLVAAFIAAMFYLLTGAFSWITSGGDKGKLETARNKIIHALLGLIVVFSVWAIMTLIGQFFGIGFPEIQFPTFESVSQGNDDTGIEHRDPNTPGQPY